MKKILFRADAKVSIGSGDLISLINLSQYFAQKGWQTHFMIRRYDLGLTLAKRFKLDKLCLIPGDIPIEDEISRINNYLDANNIDVIFLEITERDLLEYRGLIPLVIKACVFFGHAVPEWFDLAVNWDVLAKGSISAVKDSNTIFLLGPKYLVLPVDFDINRVRNRVYRKSINRLLVTFGGADEFNLTKKTVETLAALKAKVHLDIVLGAGYLFAKDLLCVLKKTHLKYTVRQNIRKMFPRYMGCDAAIGSGGLTAFELVASGTPSVLTSIYEHQIPRCQYFSDNQYCRYMGFRRIDPEIIKDLLDNRITMNYEFEPKTSLIREKIDELHKRHNA